MGITIGQYFTDLACVDDVSILMSDELQADSFLQIINALAAPLGLSKSWA